MPEQLQMFDDNPEYQAFVDKFKPKKTTDEKKEDAPWGE